MALLLAACRPATIEAPMAASTACASNQTTGAAAADWVASDTGTSSAVVPVIVSSQMSVGPSRLLFTVMDPSFETLASPDLVARLRLYALDRDAHDPVSEIESVFLDTGTGRGLYRAAVEVPCHGTWGGEVEIVPLSGTPQRARTVFSVAEAGATPAIGDPAPRSDSLTATTLTEVRRISTDPDPDPRAHRLTVAEAVTSGRPSIIFFATPAFCRSGVCGPTVEMVKRVASEYRDEVEFVNVEPYRLRETPNGLQPDLDEAGQLQTVDAVVDYGIDVEPYLFVVDADGDVAAKFEVVVDEAELRGALEDVTSPSALDGVGPSA